MAVQIEYVQDRGIYGRKSWTGYCPTLTSPFAVFKDEKGWALGHRKTGLSVKSLIPKGYRLTRKSLLDFLARMEQAEPEAMAAMNEVIGFPVHKDYRWAGRKLIDWSRAHG